jgi:hypothetical protein
MLRFEKQICIKPLLIIGIGLGKIVTLLGIPKNPKHIWVFPCGLLAENEVFDRQVPRKPRLVGGVKRHNMNDISFPGSPALWAGSFTIGLQCNLSSNRYL